MLFRTLCTVFFLILLASCSSLIDIVVSDQVLSDEIVDAALNGARFRIVAGDYQAIRQLFVSSDPRRRQAGVLIVEQTDVSAFFPELFTASRDEDSEVANNALRVIMAYRQEFKEYLTEILDESILDRRRHALSLFGKIGGEEDVPFLIRYFSDSDETIRDLASQAVHDLTDRENPFLRRALKSADPLSAAMACRTLSYYKEPADTPELIKAFDSPHSIVQKEAQLAVLRLREAGLPYLHDAVSNSANSMQTRLAALNVLQSLKSEKSVEELFTLLGDANDGIRTRANGILISYGDKAVPVLRSLYIRSDAANKNRIIQLLKEIGGKDALSLLAEALGDASSEIRREAERILEDFGSEAWETLQTVIVTDIPTLIIPAMQILRKTADPWLVQNETGLFNLIEFSEKNDIEQYLNAINKTDKLFRESILALKETTDMLDEYISLEEEIRSKKNDYLSVWQQGEDYETQAKAALQDSFDILHDYFNNREADALELSSNLRSESRRLASMAQKQKALLDAMPEAARTRGQKKLDRYNTLKDSLRHTWNSLGPEMKNIARKIYTAHGLNPERVALNSGA